MKIKILVFLAFCFLTLTWNCSKKKTSNGVTEDGVTDETTIKIPQLLDAGGNTVQLFANGNVVELVNPVTGELNDNITITDSNGGSYSLIVQNGNLVMVNSNLQPVVITADGSFQVGNTVIALLIDGEVVSTIDPNTTIDPDPTDPTDPTDPVDPVDPVDPTDPVDPIDPTDPVDPVDPTDPVDPVDPTDPNNDCKSEEEILKQDNFWGIVPGYHRTTPKVTTFSIVANIPELPQELTCFQNLIQMNINKTVGSYSNLPLLQNIRHLSFYYSSLEYSTIPKEIGTLEGLVSLSGNYIIEIPKEIGNLKNLRTIYISTLTNPLPKEIGNLNSLYELTLYFGEYQTVPDEIGNLSKLAKLSISSHENLLELPHTLGNLNRLQELNLTANKSLKHLPESLGELNDLVILDLSSNQLTSLPNSIGNLKKLTSIKLNSNKLETLPESFGELTNLSGELNLSYNQLTSLPNSIGNLKKLTSIKLNSNNLTALPESFGELTNLSGTLDLSRNQLTTLPESMSNLKKIILLDLYGNKLTTLPESFKDFKNITIDLRSNNFSTAEKNKINSWFTPEDNVILKW